MDSALDMRTDMQHWVDQWLSQREGTVSPNRAQADRTRAERYIRPAFGRRSITRITPDQIRDWLIDQQDSGVGASTLHACLTILRQTFALAFESMGLDRENPVQGITVQGLQPIRQPEDYEILDEDTLRRIFDAIDPDYRAMVRFAARTGSRWDEVLGLMAPDVYLRDGSAAVGKVRVVEIAGRFDEQPGLARLVPMSDDLREEMADFLSRTKDWRSPDWLWVFLTKRDHRHPLRPNFNIHVWRPALSSAGLDPRSITFHSLRHTAAVHMIADGLPVEEISRILGHRSVSTTRDTYKRWLIDRADRDDY